ncbi:MAG: efflux RND transporter periplasmic adaptor subunit [Pseudomonadota bacterium]
MRLLSVLTAILVVAALYLFVFQRDSLQEFAGGSEAQASPSTVVEDAETAQDSLSEATVSVVALKSTAKSVDGAVILRGRTEAIRQVEVRAETTGRVISTPLRRGESVEEGQLMCLLDPGTRRITLDDARAGLLEAEARLPEAKARLAEAEARLVEAEINDRAAARLSEGGFASETRVAATTASVEAARAGVESANSGVASAAAGIQSAAAGVAAAENELEKLEMHAPFAGLLESDTAELGSLLQPGSLCGTIIQLDTIKLVGFVPESSVERVQLGAPAGARLSSGREVIGKVSFISRSADPNTRTFRVDVDVPNPDLSLRDGQTVEIGIQAEGESAHLLPQSALTLDDAGQLGVRLVKNGLAEFAPVSVLRDTQDGIWITGLEPEVEVIVVGQEFVTTGVPVDVTYREASK